MSLLQRFFLLVLLWQLAGYASAAAERIDLSPRAELNSTTHVTIQLSAGGSNLVRASDAKRAQNAPSDDKEGNTKDEKDAKEETKLPSTVEAKLAYDEKCLTEATDAEAGTPLSIRYYDKAEATIKVGDANRTPELADEHHLIVLEAANNRPALYCPDAALTREELDLIDVVGNTRGADRLLPTKPIANGDSWANDASVIGPLLTLDTIAVCEVQSVLEESNADYAKVRLAGVVHGTADGAACEQEIRGVYLVDRRIHRITRLNLAIRENRSIGGATPGLDATAKLQITIAPIPNSTHLNDDVVAKIKANGSNANRSASQDLSFESPTLGFRIKHDRQWYVTAQGREAVTLRRIDNGDLAAQCTLTQLPSKSEGRQTSLDQFQKDVTYSLGKSFGELVSSRQWKNAAGLYCYEVVVRGLVDEVPVEWHYYLLAPESGPRMSVVVTIEKAMLERVAKTDRDLVESLQLFPALPPAQTASQPAGRAVK